MEKMEISKKIEKLFDEFPIFLFAKKYKDGKVIPLSQYRSFSLGSNGMHLETFKHSSILYEKNSWILLIRDAPVDINKNNLKFKLECNLFIIQREIEEKIRSIRKAYNNYPEFIEDIKFAGWKGGYKIIDQNSDIVQIFDIKKGETGKIIEIKSPENGMISIAGIAQLPEDWDKNLAHNLLIELTDIEDMISEMAKNDNKRMTSHFESYSRLKKENIIKIIDKNISEEQIKEMIDKYFDHDKYLDNKELIKEYLI